MSKGRKEPTSVQSPGLSQSLASHTLTPPQTRVTPWGPCAAGCGLKTQKPRPVLGAGQAWKTPRSLHQTSSSGPCRFPSRGRMFVLCPDG